MIKPGSLVRMVGPCTCKHNCLDVRDCYHQQCTVSHVFRDGGVWAVNRYGFARKIEFRMVRRIADNE